MNWILTSSHSESGYKQVIQMEHNNTVGLIRTFCIVKNVSCKQLS